jgi:hypothetical protein
MVVVVHVENGLPVLSETDYTGGADAQGWY